MRHSVAITLLVFVAGILLWQFTRRGGEADPEVSGRVKEESQQGTSDESREPRETPLPAGATRVEESPDPSAAHKPATPKQVPVERALEGRVVDPMGRPVPRFRIEARRTGERRRERTDEVNQVFEDADGNFRLENLTPGEWTLTETGSTTRPVERRRPSSWHVAWARSSSGSLP